MRLEPTLARIIRWGLWASAFIPLIVLQDVVAPFQFGKAIAFRSGIEILLALYLVLVFRDSSYRPRLNAFGWALLAFTGAYGITTLTSIAPHVSFWGTLERMGGLFAFLHYVVFYFLLISVFTERRHWQVFLDLILVAGVISALIAFGQFLEGPDFSPKTDRPYGTLGNAGFFAGYQVLIAFLAGMLSFQKYISARRRWLYRGAAVIAVLGIFVSATRGSMIAVAGGAFLFALVWSVSFNHRKAKWLLGAIFLMGVAYVALAPLVKDAAFIQRSRILDRFTDMSLQTKTVQTRLWIWNSAIEGWKESPKTMLLGWGPENFNIPALEHIDPRHYLEARSETYFDRAHNVFIESLVTMGLLGFLAHVSMLGAIVWASWRLLGRSEDEKMLGAGFIALTGAYVIHSFFLFDTLVHFIAFFSVAGFLSFTLASEGGIRWDTGGVRHPLTIPRIAFLATCFVAIGSMLVHLNVRPARANYQAQEAIRLVQRLRLNDAVETFSRASQLEAFGLYRERFEFTRHIVGLHTRVDGIPEMYGNALMYVASEVEKNRASNPHAYEPLLNLANIHLVLGAEDEYSPHNDLALSYAFQARAMSPNHPAVAHLIARAYQQKGDLDTAYEWTVRALGLNPEAGVSYWYMGLIEIERGNVAQGLELVEEAVDHDHEMAQDGIKFIQKIYEEAGEKEAYINVLEKSAEHRPDEVRYWAALSLAYVEAGRKEDAIETIRKTMELDESLRAAGEEGIKLLTEEDEASQGSGPEPVF